MGNPAPRSSRVDGNISDLFFNLDHGDNVIMDDKGHFERFDDDKLSYEAEWFLQSLGRLGVPIPTIEELITDFKGRI